MSAKLIQYSSRGDGTWSTGVVNTLLKVTSFKIDDNFGESVPTATITCVRDKNISLANDIKEGNEIRIWYTPTNTVTTDSTDRIFRGIVMSIKTEGYERTITCANWLQVLVNRAAITSGNFSGTWFIKAIIYNLIAEAIGANESTVGTYVKFVRITSYMSNMDRLTDFNCKNQCIYESLINICEGVDWWFHYDYVHSWFVFEPRANSDVVTFQIRNSTTPAIAGAIPIMEVPSWDKIAQNVATKTTVTGGSWNDDVVLQYSSLSNYTLSMLFSAQGMRNFTQYSVKQLEVAVDNYSGIYTIVDPKYYYTKTYPDYIEMAIDPNTKSEWKNKLRAGRITVTKQLTDQSYTTSVDASAAQLYGTRDKVVNQSINSYADLVNYATNLLSIWKKGTTTLSLGFKGNTNYLGRGTNIYDSIANVEKVYNNNGWTGIITQSTFSWPHPITTISISDDPLRNTSASALINKTVTNITNALTKFDLGSVLKSDGSTPITNHLDLTNKQIKNQTIENVTEL